MPHPIAKRNSSGSGLRGRSGSDVPRGTLTMRALARRLQRLEKRFGTAVESQHTPRLRVRLHAAHLRCGFQPISPERLAKLRGMSIIEILHSGRDRVAMARRESESRALSASQDDSPVLSHSSKIF